MKNFLLLLLGLFICGSILFAEGTISLALYKIQPQMTGYSLICFFAIDCVAFYLFLISHKRV